MAEKKKAADMAVEERAELADRLLQNYEEDCRFAEIIEGFLRHEYKGSGLLTVGTTPNALVFGGAKAGVPLTLSVCAFAKCLYKTTEWREGHDLDKNVFRLVLSELRNPVMLLRGSKENTVVAVTGLTDQEGDPVIIAVALGRKEAHHAMNQITSAYGKRDFAFYLQHQIDAGNLLAVNKNKANQMFQSVGVQFPMEETLISFDDSIAYSFQSVKTISTKSLDCFSKDGKRLGSLDEFLSPARDTCAERERGRTQHTKGCLCRGEKEFD